MCNSLSIINLSLGWSIYTIMGTPDEALTISDNTFVTCVSRCSIHVSVVFFSRAAEKASYRVKKKGLYKYLC